MNENVFCLIKKGLAGVCDIALGNWFDAVGHNRIKGTTNSMNSKTKQMRS